MLVHNMCSAMRASLILSGICVGRLRDPRIRIRIIRICRASLNAYTHVNADGS